MTKRSEFTPTIVGSAVPDFTNLSNLEAVARIRQLAAQGLRESTLQALTGWHRSDIWRAMTPAPARRGWRE